MRAAAVLLSLSAALVSAQESSLVSSAVAPAATTVESPPDVSVPLFEEETTQLTDDVVAELLEDDQVKQFASLFAFEDTNATESAQRRRVRRLFSRCKTAPGDLLWPSNLAWSVFDLLIGGALEPITPIASPCYPKSEYKNYNKAKCQSIVDNWDVDSLQYALYLYFAHS
jgi:hypothetical protein